MNWYTGPDHIAERNADRDRLMAVGRALTEGQRDAIVTRFTSLNPHYRGADVEDILDALADGDGNLAELEPFYEEHPELVVPGAEYATRAILWSAADLTPEAVTALLTAAGLWEG